MSEPIQFLSTAEAAKVLGFKVATLIQYSNAGKIKCAFYGRRWHYLHADLMDFAASNSRGKR